MHPIIQKLAQLLSPPNTTHDHDLDLKLERKQRARKQLTIQSPSPSEHIFLNLPNATTAARPGVAPKKNKKIQKQKQKQKQKHSFPFPFTSSSSSTLPQTQSILFSHLPPELRERIYYFVFGDTPRARFGSLRHSPWPVRRQGIEQRRRKHRDPDIALLQSCRRV